MKCLAMSLHSLKSGKRHADALASQMSLTHQLTAISLTGKSPINDKDMLCMDPQ